MNNRAAPRFLVRDVVSEAVAFWRAQWRSAAAPLVVLSASLLATTLSHLPAVVWAGYGLYVAAAIMAQGALYRRAFPQISATDKGGPMGVQWRGMEWRLLGVTALLALLVSFVLMLMIILLASVALAFAARSGAADFNSPEAIVTAMGPGGQAACGAVMIAVMVLLFWFSMRLGLAQPATAARGRVQLLSSFALTKGSVWRILGAVMTIVLPVMLVSAVGSVVAAAVRPGDIAFARSLSAAGSAVAVFFYVPINVGLTAAIYKKLAADAPQEA